MFDHGSNLVQGERRLTMKKLVYLTTLVLIANVLVSCAKATPEMVDGTPKPVYKFGEMTVEEHDKNGRIYPELAAYCDHLPELTKPGTQTADCDVPLIPRLQINIEWYAKDTAILESNWSAMSWELYIDGSQINLDEFEQWNRHQGIRISRGWVIDLVNPTAGKHTLRLVWKSDVPIDDGIQTYSPGTYEYIANFTVADR
jgi:hypothetical protein